MNLASLALLLAALSPLNPYDKLKMTVQRAVYTVDGPDTVTFTLQNIGGTTISSPFSWSVHDVYAASPLVLKPWEWVSYTWDKRDRHEKKVGPGSYRIQAGPIWNGTRWEIQAATVALTPSGRIGGSRWFPATVGNRWSYRAVDGEANELRAVEGSFGWSFMTGDPLWNLWIQYWGAPFSTLYAWNGGISGPLFRFGRAPGTEWTCGVSSLRRLSVGALDVSIVTPVGTFPESYRIDVSESSVPGREYRSLWFHRGVGIVAYRLRTSTSDKVFRLYRATIRGTDGRWYTIDRY